ncbi:hypothetical protein NQ317_016153 [Molorchus minor]|uniref:Uncharacterized protein n=1 Tax=Molorchus minor TaxID=1323400 RepID=A0ABQ9JI62_9CUCU|nr:hypothetical protein NQ317_016153 [Molorchus minor]
MYTCYIFTTSQALKKIIKKINKDQDDLKTIITGTIPRKRNPFGYYTPWNYNLEMSLLGISSTPWNYHFEISLLV